MIYIEKVKFKARPYAPKPEECTYWIDLTADPDGKVWRVWNGEDWELMSMGSGSGGGTVDAYTKTESDRKFATITSLQEVSDKVDTKQDTLVSNVNIKTINRQSILGSGNIEIAVGLDQDAVETLIEQRLDELVDGAPAAVDTLKELANAINNDPSFATTITNLLSQKVDTTTYNSEKANFATKTEIADFITETDADSKYALKSEVGPGEEVDLSGYLTIESASTTYATKSELTSGLAIKLEEDDLDDYVTTDSLTSQLANKLDITTAQSTYATKSEIAGKQDALISGETIKTVNGQSIMGAGNILIEAPEGGLTDAPADGNYYGRKDNVWSQITIPDTSTFALKSEIPTDYITDTTLEEKGYISTVDDNIVITGNESTENITFAVSNQAGTFAVGTGSNIGGISGAFGAFSSPSGLIQFISGSEDEQLIQIYKGDASSEDNFIEITTQGISIKQNSTNLTNQDLLHAAGGTTKLKTINSQSLLGEGNIEITTGTGGISDAPSDSKTYGRNNGAWVEITNPDMSTYATQTYVDSKVTELVNSAPETLDTLNELAAALGNDANFSTTITTQLGNKVDSSIYNADKETFVLKTDLTSKMDVAGGEFTGTVAVPTLALMYQGQGMMFQIQSSQRETTFRTYNAGQDTINFQIQNNTPLKLTEAGIWENGVLLENKYVLNDDLTTDLSSYLTISTAESTYAKKTDIPDVSTYLTKTAADGYYQPKGTYLTSVPAEYVTESELVLSSSYAASTATAPVASDTYEAAIAKLHAYINSLESRIAALETALTCETIDDNHQLG